MRSGRTVVRVAARTGVPNQTVQCIPDVEGLNLPIIAATRSQRRLCIKGFPMSVTAIPSRLPFGSDSNLPRADSSQIRRSTRARSLVHVDGGYVDMASDPKGQAMFDHRYVAAAAVDDAVELAVGSRIAAWFLTVVACVGFGAVWASAL
ncbi:MAG: hypothetical protein H6512_00750 [Acidimicrobiia bacterium]|nr:hypothetical protein [Acidimicrobiia bacterium]